MIDLLRIGAIGFFLSLFFFGLLAGIFFVRQGNGDGVLVAAFLMGATSMVVLMLLGLVRVGG